MPEPRKYVANNKKAFYNYEILEKIEAGISLVGCEVKSIRKGHISIRECYARVLDNEVWLLGCHILPYEQGNRFNVDPSRTRKLLLHAKQISKLYTKTKEKGLVLVPLGAYFVKGKVKIELGVGKPKKLYDKRNTLKEQEAKRDIEKGLRYKNR